MRDFDTVEDPNSNEPRSNPQILRTPCFMMPLNKNKGFYGRAEYLEDMDEVLFPAESKTPTSDSASMTDMPRTFAICGAGGMGKTQLAAEYVHSRKDRFDAIFWLNADKTAKLAEGFGKIATQLGLITNDASPDARDPVIIREKVKGWFANPLKTEPTENSDSKDIASWLVVFDNADDTDQLEDYWPIEGDGCVIFTSRDPIANDPSRILANAGAELLPFGHEEATKLLCKLARVEKDADKVVKKLGGMPLAVVQVANYMVRQKLTCSEFLEQYAEEESHSEIFEHRDSTAGRRPSREPYRHNLGSVCALHQLKYGATLLDVIAFLDPDGIHERILTSWPHVTNLDDYPRSSTVYFKARAELIQSSLATKDTGDRRLLVHRLVQDIVRSKMPPDRYRSSFAAATSLVSSIWPYEDFGWRHGVARWRVCEELFPHILRLEQLSRYVQGTWGTSEMDLDLAILLTDAGWYFIRL